MARRNKKPIFIDEPIQWHLNTSRHDRCPICGMQNLGYLGSKDRHCLNGICGVSHRLEETTKEWYETKLSGTAGDGFTTKGLQSTSFEPTDPSDAAWYRESAWSGSNAEIAVISRVAPFLNDGKIYWRKGAPWPYFYDHDGKETQACEAGSPFWHVLCSSKNWQPSRKLSPLELLAHQAPDPESIREDMGFVLA